MNRCWLGVAAIVLVAWASVAWASAAEQARDEILGDFDSLVTSDARQGLVVVEKYRRFLSSNRLLCEEIVRYSSDAPEAAFVLILFAAIGRDASLWPALAEAQNLTPELQDAKAFYAYKLKRDAPARRRELETQLEILAERPTDSHLLLFLPFADDPLWALGHIERMAEKADGAAAEMLAWAVEMLCAMNRGNQPIRQAVTASPLAKKRGWRCD